MIKNHPTKKCKARWFYRHVPPNFEATGRPSLYKFFLAMEEKGLPSNSFWEVSINPDKFKQRRYKKWNHKFASLVNTDVEIPNT